MLIETIDIQNNFLTKNHETYLYEIGVDYYEEHTGKLFGGYCLDDKAEITIKRIHWGIMISYVCTLK
jgi:hypothetical protein